ncbi:glucosyltransferase domain-containing protein [Pseudomonas sp. RAC1]|uniref:glucosyltransferase domain-containing protein n=1 Tax=Pseudomonas sp. RAC1 TaxID=3064900 RepID=UPI00271B593D|nr:glucosyltransferase domain-containing protein [Pseudomonas sp. RAC1]MDV9032970.1 glucosyltransferase domain-containing protein [Pseudomonas sp. RAC1]
MQSVSSWNRPLTLRQAQLICLCALALHVLPLILADAMYLDDVWRAQTAIGHWSGEGRLLTQWLHAGLSFAGGAINLFPLPLLLALPVAAYALARLAVHYFVEPRPSDLLVVLPLWYSPFFLQNLSYQYDGPAMALGMSAMILAITVGPRRLLAGAALIACGLGFYQVTLNLFVGLCCIEAVRGLLRGDELTRVLGAAGRRLLQALSGGVLYLLLALPWMSGQRLALLAFDSAWPGEVLRRLGVVFEHVALLFTPGNLILAIGLGLLALIGVLRSVPALRGVYGVGGLLVRGIGLLLVLLVLLSMTSGIMLIFAYFIHGARTLMGFACVLVLLLYLARRGLGEASPHRALILGLPLLSMLSLAYAYGRVLEAQKAQTAAIAQYIGQDILSHPELDKARAFYLLESNQSDGWLPAASGALARAPLLAFIRSSDFVLLPEMMTQVGMGQFYLNSSANQSPPPAWQADALAARGGTPVVDNRFYRIYLIDQQGYVVTKPQRRPWTLP